MLTFLGVPSVIFEFSNLLRVPSVVLEIVTFLPSPLVVLESLLIAGISSEGLTAVDGFNLVNFIFFS